MHCDRFRVRSYAMAVCACAGENDTWLMNRHAHPSWNPPMTKTYAQIQKQIEALTREAEKLKRKEIEGVIARIQDAIRVYGLTASDLGLAGARKGNTVSLAKRAKKKGPKSKPARVARFRDEAGNTWVGRGPRPQWLRDALASGKQLKDFAV